MSSSQSKGGDATSARILITGGAGFIGSAVARRFIEQSDDEILVYDKLTYAGNLASLCPIADNRRFSFVQADICDRAAVANALAAFQPDVVRYLAAESHVDRSIEGPSAFVETNFVGTLVLLDAALDCWRGLPPERAARFRFQHISTDEVFGSLGDEDFFREETPYSPNSPYSESKAGSDHVVRAWLHIYGLPTIVTNCSNNYGPCHFPEKLIPLTIINAIEEKPLPYGKGDENVRDRRFVDDHAAALILVAREDDRRILQCRRSQRMDEHRRRSLHLRSRGLVSSPRGRAASLSDQFRHRSSGP